MLSLLSVGAVLEAKAQQQAKPLKGKKAKEAAFQAALEKAEEAGRAAAAARVPVPMLVVERENPLDDSSPVKRAYAPVMGGVCGFAWVSMKPANKPFANWLKKQRRVRPAYYGGLELSVSGYGQSMEKKEAYAYAMAESLQKSFPEMSFYANSRMD